MSTFSNPFPEIARKIGIDTCDAQLATTGFLRWLRHSIPAHTEGNRDFIGEELHWLISRSMFYELIGFLDEFADRYSWEKGIAAEYLLRIAPREEWPSIHDPAPVMPDPAMVAGTMRPITHLAQDPDFSICLMTCDFNLQLYARLRVEEKHFNDELDFTMVDYVPLTPSELNGLLGKKADEMLRQIEKISKGKDCITTTRGVFRWTEGVFYPHT